MMKLMVERVNVWAAGIKDEPGGLAKVLEGMRAASHSIAGKLLVVSPRLDL